MPFGHLAGVLTLALLVPLTLVGCNSVDQPGTPLPASSAAPAAAATQGPPSGLEASAADPVNAGGVAEHVHNLAIAGSDIYLGTHEGLFVHAPDAPLRQVSADAFDVMGLTRAGDIWLASGHPGPGMDAPPALGLIASTDGGVSWQPLSLSGEVDFHRLVTSGDAVLGLSAHDGALLRSADGGATWTEQGRAPLFDLAVSPDDPSLVIGTTPDGPVSSQDGGATFTAIPGAPLIALLAWGDPELIGVTPSGEILASTDDGSSWTSRGSVAGQPVALAAAEGTVAVLAGGTVHVSTNGGKDFVPRITGLAGH